MRKLVIFNCMIFFETMKHNGKHNIATVTVIIERIYRITVRDNNILRTIINNIRFSFHLHDKYKSFFILLENYILNV